MGNKNNKDEKRTALDTVRQVPNGLWLYRAVDTATEEFIPKDPDWHEFTDIEQTIIEKAYQENQTQIDIDPYIIDLSKLIRNHKVGKARKWRMKRDEQDSLPIRYNRFHLHPLLEFRQFVKTSNSETGRTLFIPFAWEWFKISDHRKTIGDGLLIEGDLARCKGEAMWMIQQLSNSSLDDNQIRLTALAIFNLESFLYPLVQKTLRTNDQSKMSSLGPIVALLGDCQNYSSEIDRLLFSGIAYFSSNHDPLTLKQQLRDYLHRPNQFVKVDTFISATRNRSIAEQADDAKCLFIINIKRRRNVNAIDISTLSRRPQEQEILILPNVPFMVKKIKCLKDEFHRHIVYLTVEN